MNSCPMHPTSVYRVRRDFDNALNCQLNALAMRTSLFPPGTPQPYSSLGLTYLDMGNNKKAIETLKLACDYWTAKSSDASNIYLNSIETYLATTSHPHGHPDIGFTLHHMASNLLRMNDYMRGKLEHAIAVFQR